MQNQREEYELCADLGLHLDSALMSHEASGWNLTFLNLRSQRVTNSPAETNLDPSSEQVACSALSEDTLTWKNLHCPI